MLYEGVKNVSIAACERIASGEVVNLAEGLVKGLLYRGEGGVAAGIALSELFRIRGSDITRANLYLVDSIIAQMRQMENASCKKGAAPDILIFDDGAQNRISSSIGDSLCIKSENRPDSTSLDDGRDLSGEPTGLVGRCIRV